MATYQIPAPEPFDFTKTEDWPKWARRFERFRQSSDLTEKSEPSQVNTLIYSMGDAADDIFHSFRLTEEQVANYKTVREKFDAYFSKKKNVIYERVRFNMRKQDEGEQVDAFITALYNLASKCEYGELHDEMIHDRIVVGIANPTLSEKMQLDEGLTLEKAAKLARECESIKQQQPKLREMEKKDVDLVRQPRSRKGQHRSKQTQGMGYTKSTNHKVCTRCGNDHLSGKEPCRARLVKCHKCGKVGHYQRMCRAINTVETTQRSLSDSEDWKFLGAITEGDTETRDSTPWMYVCTADE